MTDVVTERDIVFATADGTELKLDLHLPAMQHRPLPLAIFIHGGGWRRGTRVDYEESRLLPVSASGIAVASVDYRLSTQAPWPAQLEDIRTAMEVIPGMLGTRGIELDGRTALWGCSAGGHLALMTALTAANEGRGAPDVVVAWFPVTDLRLMDRAPKGSRTRNPPFLPEGAIPPAFERMLLGLDDAAADTDAGLEALRAASPIAHTGPGNPPILLVHGDEDALVPLHHSETLHDALTAAASPVSTLVVRGATHEDPAFDTPQVLGAVAAFISGAPRPS